MKTLTKTAYLLERIEDGVTLRLYCGSIRAVRLALDELAVRYGERYVSKSVSITSIPIVY